MFKAGDVVRIVNDRRSWEEAFGKGVFDCVLEVEALGSHSIDDSTLVSARTITDPHGSFKAFPNGGIKIRTRDLAIEPNYFRNELQKMKDELGV